MFTPTERRILEELADGMPRKKEQLRAVIDSQCDDFTLRQHIANIRKKLLPQGQDVVCTILNGYSRQYRWVRLLGNPYNGYH